MGKISEEGKYLFAYMASILIIIVIGLVSYRVAFNHALEEERNQYVAILNDTEQDSEQILQMISLLDMKIETQEQIITQYLNRIEGTMYAIVFGMLITFAISTFCFVLMLQRKKKQQLMETIMKYCISKEDLQGNNKVADMIYKQMTQEIERKVQENECMNSYLAHEQKNLLGILSTKYSNEGDEKGLAIIKKINESIEDYLTISDYDSNSIKIVDLSLIAAEACDYYTELCPDLRFFFDEEETYEILAKERWIYRAVSNLLDNAIKYGEGSSIELHVEKKLGSVLVKVIDHGKGIPEEQIDYIWENRFQEKNMSGNGYGIGLSLVKHVCELCNGYYYVQSEEGCGSTFYLSFPAAK